MVVGFGDKLAAFFMEHHFYLKEQLTDKLWLFRLGYLTGVFLEINEMSLSLQGKKNNTIFASNKIQTFKQK